MLELHVSPSAQLAKIDIKSTYRIIPVHPDNCPLLGMSWGNHLYVDKALPFGLRFAAKLFNAIADTLEWITKHTGREFQWHYLDDFITIGHPGSEECITHLHLLINLCIQLGIPLATEKVEKVKGPSTCLPFLGIKIDSVAQELWLLAEKLSELGSLLKEWEKKS